MTGADVLELVVRKNLISTAGVAHQLTGVFDGRKVRPRLAKLERAGLLEVVDGIAIPTARGREVDAILARITAARGGEFAPRLASGITGSESVAL